MGKKEGDNSKASAPVKSIVNNISKSKALIIDAYASGLSSDSLVKLGDKKGGMNTVIIPFGTINELRRIKRDKKNTFDAENATSILETLETIVRKGGKSAYGKGTRFPPDDEEPSLMIRIYNDLKDFKAGNDEMNYFRFENRDQYIDYLIQTAYAIFEKNRVNPEFRKIELITSESDIGLFTRKFGVEARPLMMNSAVKYIADVHKGIDYIRVNERFMGSPPFPYDGERFKKEMKKKVLYPNEYFVFSHGENRIISRYDSSEKMLVKIDYKMDPIFGFFPLNDEQRCAIDALLDPNISVVFLNGVSGAGKTLLTILAAIRRSVRWFPNDIGEISSESERLLKEYKEKGEDPAFSGKELEELKKTCKEECRKAEEALLDKEEGLIRSACHYNKIICISPHFSPSESDDRKDQNPSDMIPRSIRDNLIPLIENYAADAVKDARQLSQLNRFLRREKSYSIDLLLKNEFIEFAKLANLEGASIQKSFVICDAAERYTTEEMKYLMKRVALDKDNYGSKTVFCGNPAQEATLREGLTPTNNGFVYAIEALKNNPYAAVVTLTKSVKQGKAQTVIDDLFSFR